MKSVFALFAGIAVAANAISGVLADSVADYSGVQGTNDWYYGYYSGSLAPSTFQQMTIYNPASSSIPDAWVVDYDLPAPQYWTLLFAEGGHPNGTTTSGGRTAVEQWAVRRWISNTATVATLSGKLYDMQPGAGNGVTAHIFVNGSEIYRASINDGNTAGINYSVPVTLGIGSVVDFAIDPRSGNDIRDTTGFTALISSVPEVGSRTMMAFGAIAIFSLLALRRASGA